MIEAGAGRARLAWLGLVGAALLGTYAVPTFVYVLGSAFAWLGLQAARQRRWGLLARVGAAGLGAGLGILLLYAPTLYVSGPAALLDNAYVRQLTPGEFWRGLPAHAWFTEGYLLGQRRVGAVGTALGLGLFAWVWGRRRAGRLAPALARRVGAVGLPALWFGAFPYGLILAQRVLPPERTWLYKSWFFFVLVALGLAGWPGGWHRPARRWLAGVGAGLFVLYQVAGQLRLNAHARQATADHRAVFAWLRAHPAAGPVLIPDLYLWAWLRFETHIEAPGQLWRPDQQPRPGRAYAYRVTRRSAPRPAGRVVLASGQLLITQAAPATQGAAGAAPAAGPPRLLQRP